MGFAVIFDLAAYFFTLLGALVFQALVVYGVLLRALTPLAPRILRKKCEESGHLRFRRLHRA